MKNDSVLFDVPLNWDVLAAQDLLLVEFVLRRLDVIGLAYVYPLVYRVARIKRAVVIST